MIVLFMIMLFNDIQEFMTFGHRLMRLAPNFRDQCAKYGSSSCWLQKIPRNHVPYNLKLKASERLCYAQTFN